MAFKRRASRIVAMKALFAYEHHKEKVDKIFDFILTDGDLKLDDPEFAKGLIKGTIKHQKDILAKIQEMAPAWPVEKIAPVDRAILEIGAFEILFSEDVPPVVAINEAIEIAKEFGDLNSAKFINGVLSSIMTKHCTYRDPKTGEYLKK
ncbi:MAG: NusB antitermination factor, N utilization substance protein B [Candidatus Peregrinibacteria bacterium GW2011_GWC2_39_14]|nr:MAG: N utilization substance protein B-like protein [Candidatus Peregrinibacteria bacterium GW2011_GWA2_38_36]KKR06728.1 MAG: NusB antitermination factor, N utilization substance protein B [Candidatus Peregrinibacteria bacterium GW2011_GWC2_39_14]